MMSKMGSTPFFFLLNLAAIENDGEYSRFKLDKKFISMSPRMLCHHK